MKKTATLLLTLCLLLMAFASTKAQTIVYNSTSSQYYRIPAMATAYDGTLLLFGDNRYSHNADVGSSGNARIDVMLTRVSYNTSSATYSSPSTSTATNITSGYSSISQCYGDAAVVADRESNNVRLICVGGSNGWTSNKEHYTMLSTNNGQTWSTPTLLSVPNTSDINGFFFASGRIFQSRVIKNGSYYRIYTALLTPAYENRVYYSDDFGGSWTQLGGTAVTSGDEAKLEELPNGDVIISSRYAGGRRFNKYHYTNTATAAGSWGTQGSCAFTAGCAVNGEMLTFEAYRTSDNTQVTLMLLSTATGYSRISVKVFYREIDNNTTVSDLSNINNWSSYGPLPNTSSSGAYSTMTLLKNNNIGLFYEGQSEAGYDLYYIAYTLEELTNQAYTFDEPVVVVPETGTGTETETGTGTENGNGTGNGTEDDNNITTSATYYWTGAVSSDWNNAGNWATSAPSNSIARSMMDVTPDANGNVVIPKLTSGSYPVLTDAKTIANLYIAPGAAIGNQWRLTVTGKVYTDVEIPSNQWVRMCMPLRDTYSGDMFTELQGGRAIPADSTFTPAYYEPTPGNTGNNRVFPYAIYQRVFSDAATHQLSDVQGDNVVEQLNTAWSRPYNALAERYQVGEGFDLWSPSTNATSTFRFPSATNTYYYWYNNGQPSQLSETVNHTASGTMAYNQDVLDVTITRAARASDAGVPMYAVGNPAFAHLDIAKFIRVNSYGANHSGNAAVVGNITPYLYFYNENGTLNSGEAGETIYYLDQDKNLYTVNAAVDNSNMPTGTNTSASAAYVAPTRGFRVMAGQAEVSSVEPKLIGQYTNATYQMAPVPYYTSTDQGGTSGVNKCGYGRSLWSTTPTDANDGVGVASLVFSATSYPDTIELQNFAGMAVAKAAIDPINQTLTIPGNSNVAFYNHSTWSSGGSTTGFTNAFIYGCTDGKNLEYSYQNQNSHSIGYANNVSPTQDVIIDYTISGTTVTLSLRNAFAIYDASQPTRYTSASGSSISSSEYYNSFDCFESMTASLNFSTNEAAYANMNVFGTYRYQITEDANKMSMPNSDNIVTGNYVDFQILPIEGNYNIVRVRGLYHYAGSSSLVDAIATVTPQDANGQSTINIPAAQLVYNEGDMSSNAFFIYGFNTGRDSLTFTFNYNNGGSYLTLPTNTYIQISQQTSNPNKDANSPGYRGGAYSTSVTSGDTTSITNPTTFAAGTYLMSYNNTYVGYDGTNVVNTTTQPSLTNKDYSFTFAQTGNYYTIQNGNGKYLNVSTNGTLSWDDTGTANWTVTYQNSTLYLYYRSGNGWNRTYYYLQYDNDNGNLSIVNNGKSTSTSYPWKIYAEVTTGGTTTTLTCIPKVADWSGASSGTSGSTITWSVGTNYEAINLKYTSAMFNANPGSSSTNAPAAAPRRTAAQGSTMATVMLESNGHSVNTLITKRANGSNGYNVFEDAVLVDVNDNNLMLATMAGTHAVAVNTLGDTTAVRLLLHNVNGTITLTFDNMAALGNNVRLYDAETGTATPLNPQTATITLNTTVNDSPLRYSLVWDTPTGIDDIELTDDNVWFQAYSAAKGTIKVVSNDNLTSVRLFDATGKLVASRINNGNETMFEYLLSGVYMVEASNGKEVKTIKVSVK